MDSDDDLLERSSIDPLAFEPLVERHAVALHSYLARRAPVAADDLLADVWLAAFEARGRFDRSLGGARGWLFGIARNVLFSHYRQRITLQLDPASEPTTDVWDAVDDRLDAAAVAPELHQAMSVLPDIDREMLLLIAWEQLSPAEAAQAVGIPAGTARSRLHRARNAMRERLGLVRQVPVEGTTYLPRGAH